jgi:predicted permease
MRTVLRGENARSLAAGRRFRDQSLSELARLPQTVGVAAGTRYLIGASPGHTGPMTVEGIQSPEPDVVRSFVSPGYFRVLQIPLIAGRAFTDADDDRSPRVVIVSQSLATKLWPGQSAIGKRVWMEDFDGPPKDAPDASDWVSVVGVVGDIIHGSIKVPPPRAVYYPLNQAKSAFMATTLEFGVRTAGDPATTARAMRQVMRGLAPDQPVEVLAPLAALVARERLEPLFQARLVVVFSLVALILAAVGNYSTLAYAVAQRRRELGIRLALGAPPASVVGLVLRRGVLLAAVGVFAGLAGSLALTRGLQSALYRTSATDPRIFAASAALLVVIAVLASIVPARRATKVDPIVELREV